MAFEKSWTVAKNLLHGSLATAQPYPRVISDPYRSRTAGALRIPAGRNDVYGRQGCALDFAAITANVLRRLALACDWTRPLLGYLAAGHGWYEHIGWFANLADFLP